MHILKRPTWIPLVVAVLLVITAAYRITLVQDARLAGDEASQYATARHVADLKYFPVTGVNMTGDAAMTPGGLYHLVMSVPFFFSDDPRAAGVYLVLLNLAGILLGWMIFRREFGEAAALVVLILSLFNPFSVFFSDRQWNPNLLVPLGYLWIWLLLSAFRGEGRFRWGWLAALLVVSPQIHMSCPHLTIMTLVMMGACRPAVRWGHVAAGSAIGLATYAPYFVVDALDGWSNTSRILTRLSEAAAPWYEAFRGGFHQMLYAAGDYTYFLGKGFWFPMTEWGFIKNGGLDKYAALTGLPAWTGYVSAALVVLALAIAAGTHLYTFGRVIRGWIAGFTDQVRTNPLPTLAVLNIPLLILLMLKTQKPFYPHYSMVLFGLAMVPVAVFVGRIESRRLVGAILAVVTLVAINQSVLTARYYRAEESKGSVHLIMEATRTILMDSGTSSFRLNVDMPGTRIGNWPFSVIAREYYGSEWRERKDQTRLTYIIAPAGSRHENGAATVWDIDGKRLIRREERR